VAIGNARAKIMHRPQILSHRIALGGSVMKAAVVPAIASSWQIKDVPQPQPGPNQVLVKMHASGICYTDVHLTLGHFPGTFPRILGHRLGRVTDVAPLAVFLASAESAWITGEVIRAAGGLVVAT
jgi:NAD(P)-dependent dehydrogenase (short-subunit alcohol dehydrogenase family)